ncbi:MAG: hypothetical protein Q8O82_06335 [Pseudorhodobacter sp.]|nr:hypothetical protein [Pseudorhodobacter sp.]
MKEKMSHNKFGIILFSVAIANCAMTPARAFGNDEHWVSGWGMGTKEAIITKGPGNQIYVACEEGSTNPSSISFMLGGDGPRGDQITLTFDETDPQDFWITNGEITSDCHACAANFDTVIELLKSHNSVHVRFENGLSTRFSLSGSGEAIGQCVAGFYR